MNEQRLTDAITAARARVDAMCARRAHDGGSRTRDAMLLGELDDAFEELTAAEGELREQSDQIAAVRDALEAGFRRYHELFDFMPDGYVVTDEVGVIREVNDAALGLLAAERSQVIGRPIVLFATAPDRVRLRRRLAGARRAKECQHDEIDLMLERSGRAPLPVALTISRARRGEEEAGGFRMLVRDLRERRKAEATARAASAAQAANEAKDEFLAMVSHELRNPLHAILSWSDIMRNDTLPQAERDVALETIERNARQLNRLVGDLLDVSRLTQQKLVVQLQACDLAAVVADAYDVVRSEIDRRQQRFSVKLHDPGAVAADPARLQQIVTNLLGNAVKFTPEGGIIDLRLNALEDAIEILVRDNGIGIAPDLLPHVFDRFCQGQTASTERGGGLGLGLPIARTLARMHGGDLWAESAGTGHGATFTVRLPRRRPSVAAASCGEPTSGVPVRRPLLGMRVVILCPERDAGARIVFDLRRAGAVTRTVASPAKVKEGTRSARVDALVVVVPQSNAAGRLLDETSALEQQVDGLLPVLAVAPSQPTAQRWLSLPAEFQLCTDGALAPDFLCSRLAVLAQLSGRNAKPSVTAPMPPGSRSRSSLG